MGIKKGASLELKIEKMAFGGEGIAKHEEMIIFVKDALIGQRVIAQITHKKPSYAKAKLIEVVEKSPFEEDPKYSKCPGCTYQNLTYEKELEIKHSQLEEFMRPFPAVEIKKIIPAPQRIKYRNKMEFSCGFEVMKVEKNENGSKKFIDEGCALGFHPLGDWARVVEIPDAIIASDEVNQIRKIIQTIIEGSSLKPWNPKIHTGFWRGVIFRSSQYTGEIMINIIVSKKKPHSFWDKYIQKIQNDIKEENPEIKISGIYTTVHEGKSDAISDPQIMLQTGEENLTEKVGSALFTISPFSFFQTNTKGTQLLYKTISDTLEISNNAHILDLFCGAGSIGIYLAKEKQCDIKITGIEMVEEAVEMANDNARANNLNNTNYIAGKAEEVLPALQNPIFDAVIVDPPRTGLHPKAMEILASGIETSKIVYVSCNPATFARDAQILEENGWKLTSTQAVDMFPCTPHFEVVSVFVKN